VLAANQGSAGATETPTLSNFVTPSLANPQVVGGENFNGTYSVDVDGQVAGNYPLGTVNFVLEPGAVPLCSSSYGPPATATATGTQTLISPESVTYACTAVGLSASLVTPGSGTTYTVEATFVAGLVTSSTLVGVTNNNSAETSSGVQVTVYPVVTPTVTTAINPSATPAAGTAISDTATISTTGGPTYSPAATVTFNIYAGTVCTGTVLGTTTNSVSSNGVGNNGTATSGTLLTPTNVTGSYAILATYNGNAFNNAAAATCETLVVQKFADTIATSATSTATTGSPISDQVTISGLSTSPAPTGEVILTLYSGTGCTGATVNTWVNVLTLTGTQTWTDQYNNTPAGTYSWQASYAGDTNNAASTSPCETGGTGTTVTNPPPPPPPPATLYITTHSVPSGSRGRPYFAQIMATGGTGAYHWTTIIGHVPPGTALNPTTGVISGTLPGHSVWTFEVQVTDSGTPTPQTATHWYTIYVA